MKWIYLIFALAGAGLTAHAAGPKLPPINPYAEQAALNGKFIWFDLVTDDVREAKRFYNELFGWEFATVGTGASAYTFIRHQQRSIGGIVFDERTEPEKNESQWIGFISVPDVSDTEAYVKIQSGQVLVEPAQLPGRGTYAIFTDTEGAVFAACQSISGDPPDYQPPVNEWLWAECWSTSPEQAAAFYKAVGGYKIRAVHEDSDHVSLHLLSQGFGRAGIVRIPDPQIKPGWLYYIRVADLARTLERVRSLGGRVLLAPEKAAGTARIAIIEDPTGAPLGLAEWNPVMKEKE